MFNVRVKKYLDTEQIQIFSEPLQDAGSEREDRRKIIRSTGEICPTNRSIIYNPFDDVFEAGYYLRDDDANIGRSVRRAKNVIYDVAKCNKWEWFVTLTFNKDKVDRFSFDECSRKMSVWLNNMRKKCAGMKYLIVPELHKDGAWHFHGLFSDVENMVFIDSGKTDKKGRVIYNLSKYKYGFTTATPIDDTNQASGYITKYMQKDMFQVSYNKRRYWASKNLTRPEVIDMLVEGAESFADYMLEQAIYSKRSKGYYDVTYIECEKGSTDFMLETEYIEKSCIEEMFEYQSIRQTRRSLSQME